jgi:hypothetical protein
MWPETDEVKHDEGCRIGRGLEDVQYAGANLGFGEVFVEGPGWGLRDEQLGQLRLTQV